MTVERAALDLGLHFVNWQQYFMQIIPTHISDSFYYDDLQNAIHDNLAKTTVHTIVEILNTWESTVTQYYASTNMNTFDLLENTNFNEI